MKRTWIAIFLAVAFLAGCGKNLDDATDKSAVQSTEASAVETESAPPESTAEEESEVITDAKPQFEHAWQVLYYDKLMEYVDNPLAEFNIYDLNGDGTPELLLSDDPSHAGGGILYAVNQEELNCVGFYGSWGGFQYDFERNFIHSGFGQMGSSLISIYHFENGGASKIVSFYSYDGCFPTMPEAEYEINDKKVSEDVFNAEREAYSFEDREDFIVRKYETTQSMASQNLLCKRNFLTDKKHAKTLASSVKQDNPLPMLAVLP